MTEETPKPAKSRFRRGLRWGLRWTLRIGGGLVLLLLGVLAFVMLTGAGTHWVVSTGVRTYADMIPGDIRVEQIDGTLVGGITLDGLVLEDARGHTLVAAERVTLALSWTALTGKHVAVEDLSLTGVVVDLPTEGAGFGDLAPPPSDEPEPPSETLGPDLPVRISGTIAVDGLDVVQADDALVSVGALELGLDASGTEAEVKLAAALDVPVADLEIRSIELEARWAEPAIVLERLVIETNQGEVELARVEADVAKQSGRLEGLRVVAAGPAWAELTGLDASLAPTITFDADGTASELEGELVADLGEGGKARLRISGGVQPTVDIHAELRVDTDLETFVPELPPRALHVDTELEVSGALDGLLTAALDVTCRGCGEAQRPMRLRIGAEAADTRLFGPDTPAWVALADLDLAYEGTTVALDGAVAPDGTASARLELPVARLEALGRAAAGYIELPPLEGTADATVDCMAERSAPTIVCVVDAGIEDGAPVKLARVQATAATTGLDSLLADIRGLRVSAQGADVRLVGDGATVRLNEHEVVVEGLGLLVATATGDGKVTVGGALRKEQQGVLTARLVDVDLGLARTFVPDLGIDGRLDGSVRVSGTPAVPQVAASLRTKGLTVAGFRIGNVDLGAGYREQTASADVDVRGGDVGRWKVNASARAALSLDPAGFEPRLSRPLRLDVQARDVDLGTLARKVEGMPELSGRMGLDVSLRGNATRPVVHATVTGSKLVIDEHALGELAVVADYDGGRAKVVTTLEHPQVESLRLEAEAPVRLTLDGPPHWAQGGEHEVTLQVRKAELVAANDFADVDLGGTLDLDVGITGSALQPKLDLLASLDRVAYENREVASGAVHVTYGDDALETSVDLRGPAFAGLGVQANIPVTAGVSGATWHPEREHRLSVALVGVSLFEAAGWMNEPLDVGGHLDATVDVRGVVANPVVTATANGRRVTYGGRDVGEVMLDARYRAQAIDARLEWQHDPTHRASVRARVPLRVDAEAGEVKWLANAPHQLRVDIPRIDPPLLEPFVDLPEDADFATSCVVLLDGSARDFALSAAMRGYVRSPEGHSARVSVDIDADPRRQHLALSVGPNVTATLSTEADVAALRAGTTTPGAIPIEGRVLVDSQSLAFLAELAPESLYNVQGQLDVDATIRGTPDAPQLDGWAELGSGAMTLVALRQRLTGMAAKVDFSNDRIVLEKLVTNSGTGRLVGDGVLSVRAGGTDGALHLQLDQMPAQSPGLPRLEVTSKIDAELEASSDRARIDVSLAGTRVDVLASSVEAAKPIPSSAGVRYVGSLDAPERSEAHDAEDADPMPWTVRLEMVDPLRIVGPAVDMSWDGSIVAEAEGGEVRTSGALASTEGFIELLSNRFDIERGTVTFAEGDEMQLFADLLASSRIGEVDVSAEIRGPLPRPELRLTSVPTLTESQIFTVMLTGEADVDSLDPEEAQAQAASLLAAVSSPALQRQLNDRLRVDRIGVGVGETTRDPILTVGKNVSRHVYAETQYRHNAPVNNNRAELRVRYRFAPRWSLESFFGDAAAGGLAIFWTRAFDSKRR